MEIPDASEAKLNYNDGGYHAHLSQIYVVELLLLGCHGIARSSTTERCGAAMANMTVVRTSVNGKKVLATTHTDSNGHFSFKVPDGRYTLRFVAPGFKTVIIRVTVFHKIHKMLNVEMYVGMSQGSGQTQPGPLGPMPGAAVLMCSARRLVIPEERSNA